MPNIPFEQIKATVLADREARATYDAQAPFFAAESARLQARVAARAAAREVQQWRRRIRGQPAA